MRRYLSVLLFLSFIAPGLLPGAYMPRYRANGAWYYGSTTAFVGQDQYRWDWDREPLGWYNVPGSGAMVARWDFEGITATSSDSTLSAAGFQLPNGTIVRLGLADGGTMAGGLKSSWPSSVDRKKIYYVVNSSPAANNGLAVGTFQLAETPGGTAIPLTTDGSGIKLSFAGFKQVLTLEMAKYLTATVDPETDIITTDTAHGFTNTTVVRFMRDDPDATMGIVLPQAYGAPVETHDSVGNYCAVVLSTTTFKLRLMANADTNCPSNNIPPSNTGTVSCVANSTAPVCTVTSGMFWQAQMAFKFTSFVTGAPSNVTLGQTYWTTTGTAGGTAFRFSDSLVLQNDNVVPSENFTATFEVATLDFDTAGSNVILTARSLGGGSSYYVRAIRGYPQGTVFSWRGPGTVKSGSIYSSATTTDRFGTIEMTENMGTFVAKIPAISAPGDTTVEFDFGPNATGTPTDPQTFRFPLHLETLVPIEAAGPAPSAFTAVPNLAQWEGLMTGNVTGSSFGDFGGQSYGCSSPSRESFAATKQKQEIDNGGIYGYGALNIYTRGFFYDGAKNWYDVLRYNLPPEVPQAADKENAKNCADYLADYQARYLNTLPTAGDPCCSISGVMGMYEAYGRFMNSPQAPQNDGGRRFRQALLRVAQIGGNASGKAIPKRMREASWAADYWLVQQKIEGRYLPYYDDQIEVLIGFQLTDGRQMLGRGFTQPFMIMGIIERPLTYHYKQVHRDPRIPIAMKAVYDRFWSEWYNPTTHAPLYNPNPYGDSCTIGCQKPTCPQLNSMSTAGYWWLWRITGDNTYRDRGDELFANQYVVPAGTGCSAAPYTMKEWNETMFRNGDGMELRTGRQSP